VTSIQGGSWWSCFGHVYVKGKVVRFPDIMRCMTCYVHATNRGVAAAFKPVSSGLYYNLLDIIIRTFSASDIFKYSLFFFRKRARKQICEFILSRNKNKYCQDTLTFFHNCTSGFLSVLQTFRAQLFKGCYPTDKSISATKTHRVSHWVEPSIHCTTWARFAINSRNISFCNGNRVGIENRVTETWWQ